MNELMPAEQRPSARLAGLLFLGAVIVGLLFACWQAWRWLQVQQQMPVGKVMVSGQLNQLAPEQVQGVIRRQHPGSFFTLKVADIHQTLLAQPWVYQASVRKRWPNHLHIHVTEQVAAAKWNDDSLLNQYGDSFTAGGASQSLPRLYGPGGSEQTALQSLRVMQSLLSSTGLQIEELLLSERYAWQLKLDNGIALNLGRSEFIDRLQRFVDMYPLLVQQPQKIQYVDLRYDTGLAVGWQQTQSATELTREITDV